MRWQEEFKAALIDAIVIKGGKVKDSYDLSRYVYSYSGWQDYSEDYRDTGAYHIATCAVDAARSTYDDSEWQEFQGTFAEEPWGRRTGIDAVVTCVCGKLDGVRYRYEGGLAELIKFITS